MKTTMNFSLFGALALHEIKVRMRRKSSWFVILLMLGLAWLMISDPASGKTLLVIDNVRIRYTSAALALGSFSIFGFLMGLFGFYLTRGRTIEDLRCGVASLIASTPVSNLYFVLARVIGLVMYLMCMMLAYGVSVMVLQAVRGEGTIEFWVYAQVFILMGLPMLCLTASLAVLFDSVHFLIGKRGDVLYFFLWMAQIVNLEKIEKLMRAGKEWAVVFDTSGLITSIEKIRGTMQAKMFAHGVIAYDPSMASVTMPALTWSTYEILMRVVMLSSCLLPIVLAAFFFHRYSPELVKASRAQKRRSPLAFLNQWSRPFARPVQGIFKLSGRMNNLFGQILAEVGLSLVSAPFAVLAMLVVNVLALVLPQAGLSALLVAVIGFWGVLICDVFTRDYQVDLELSSLAVSGRYHRFVRQIGASVVLGLLLCGLIALRLFTHDVVLACVLLIALLSLSSIAAALGLMTKTSRSFMCLFLFWWFIAIQTPSVAVLDVAGFNRSANWNTMQWQLLFIVITAGLSFLVLRFKTDKR